MNKLKIRVVEGQSTDFSALLKNLNYLRNINLEWDKYVVWLAI